MGWYGTNKHYGSVKEYAEAELKSKDCLHMVCSSDKVWQAVRITREDGTAQALVVLHLIRRSDGCFMEKTISEDMGPVYHDCPASIYKHVKGTEPWNEYSRKWREVVEAELAWKKESKTKLIVQRSLHLEYTGIDSKNYFAFIKVASIKPDLSNIPEWIQVPDHIRSELEKQKARSYVRVVRVMPDGSEQFVRRKNNNRGRRGLVVLIDTKGVAYMLAYITSMRYHEGPCVRVAFSGEEDFKAAALEFEDQLEKELEEKTE